MTEELKEYYKSNRTITEGTYKKYQGMYLGVQNNPSIKENRNILVTYFPSNNVDDCDYITYPKKYKRDTKIKSTGEIRKAGQTYPTTKRIVRKHKSDMYPNLLFCWQRVYDYPQVSYGFTCNKRSALIIDSDQYYQSFETAKETVSKFTSSYNLPEITYILRNPQSGHIQFGWITEEDFEVNNDSERDKFNSTIKLLAKLYMKATNCDGDICYNGPSCKNPFYEGFESEYHFDKIINKDSFLSKLDVIKNSEYNKYNNLSLTNSSYNNTVVTLKQSLKTRVGNRHNNKFGDKSTSRDANQVPALRNYIWKYMREHDGNKPNQREAFEAYLEIAKEASKITNKPVTPITELQATFKCTFKWSVSHYRAPDRKEGGEYSGAAFGRFIQSVRKGRLLVETLKLKQEGKKNNTEIAKELGVSRNSVIRYLSQNPEKTIIDVENFVKWYTEFVYDDYGAGCVLTNSGNDLMFSKYHDLYCLCKEVLLNYEYIKLFSSYSSYNNTVVTLTVSGTTTDLVDTSRTENIKHEMLKATTKEEEYLKYIENELNNQQNSIEEVPKSNVALSKSDQEWLKLMNKQYFKTA